MTYTTSIANGCTIIKFELEEKPRRALISHCGKDGKYFRIDYSYKSKRYFIGQRKDIEDARELKRIADEHLDDGTFWEWLDQLKKRG